VGRHAERPCVARGGRPTRFSYDEAITTLNEVIERRERALGAEHPLVVENDEWLTEWRTESR